MSTTIFTADDGIHGRELWRTDGTASGTFMITDITPGGGSSFATSSGSFGVNNPFVSVPGHVFFTRNDGTHGTELWATDGTASGTGLVTDIAPAGAGSSPANLTSAGGRLYFSANDGSGGGAEPWVSDGTAAGTIRLAASGVLAPRDFTAFNGKVYFDANNGDSGSSAFARGQIWVTDGTAAGTTTVLSSIMPTATAASVAFLANAGSGLVFAVSDSASGGGAVLGFSDGTSAGTTTFALQAPDGGRVFPSSSFAIAGGLVYFGTQTANVNGSASNYQIWVSDGTQAGTHAVADAGTVPSLFAAGGKVYFANNDAAHGAELWTVDTTGAHLVSDLTSGTVGSNPSNFFDYGGKLVFSASGGYGISDGTTAGTSYFDPSGTTPSVLQSDGFRYARPELGTVGGKLLLGLDDRIHGYEVFASDGTPPGTNLVEDINITINKSYPLAYFSNSFRIPYNSPNGLIFIGTDPAHGDEPWVTNGTLAGTHLLADLTAGPAGTGSRATGGSGSYAFGFQDLANGEVFFDGYNLYRSDDLALRNASLLYSFSSNSDNSFASVNPGGLTTYNGSAYFQASDATHRPRLWTTDGTVAGTHQVFDPATGTSGPINPTDISVAGGKLVFESVPDQIYPFGPLWASDGTAIGTQKIRDGNFHKIGQLDQSVILVGNDATVSGGTTTYGPSQIYASDGTAAGTQPILTSVSNYGRYASQFQSIVGNLIVFDFNDGVHGDELWSTNGTATGTQLIADISPGSQSTGFLPFISDGLGHLLFIAGPNSSAPTQLWITDGTAVGTRMLNGSFPSTNFTFWHGNIYYSTNSNPVLYQADSTGLNPIALTNLSVSTFLQSTDRLYFIASDAAGNGRELWASDGTAAGTVRLTDSYAVNSSQPQSFTTLLSAAVEPVAPPSIRLSNDTGASASDAYTRDASLTITPSQNGDTLAYTIDGNPTAAYDPTTLSQGRHTVLVVETQASGQSSAPATLTFTLDTQRPTATGIVPATSGPTSAATLSETVTFSEAIAGLDVGDFTVTGTDGATARVASVTASGSPGVYTVGLSDVTGAGSVRLVLLNDGTVQDIAGNPLVDSLTGPATSVDHSTPPAGATRSVNGTSDGVINAAEAVAVDFTVAGLDPAAHATASFNDGTHMQSVLVAANGTVSVDLSGFNGSVTTSLTITDTAGNTATAAGNTVRADTVAPAAPSAPADAGVANGYVDAAHNTAVQALTGTAEPSSTVAIFDGTVQVGTTTADVGTGVWGYTIGVLADGSTHSYTATATDAAGNAGPAGPALAFTVDATAPTMPSLALAHDTGASGTDRITSDATLTITGVAAGTSLTYTVDGVAASAYDPASLAEGAHTVVVTRTNGSSGASPSGTITFTLDHLAPVITVTAPPLSIAASSPTGAPVSFSATASDAIDGSDPVLFSENGATVSSGQTFQVGDHTLIATATDRAGNTAQSSFGFTVASSSPNNGSGGGGSSGGGGGSSSGGGGSSSGGGGSVSTSAGTYSPSAGQIQTVSEITSGSLTIEGGGTLVITGTNTYTGPTTVNDATLLVDGSIVSPITVQSGATLGGHGSTGTVAVYSGGILSPGNSPGVLSTKDLSLAAGAVLKEELGGTGAGQFDQLKVNGTVVLAGATLAVSAFGGFTSSRGDSFVFIDNDGTDAVQGTFVGLSEGANLNLGSQSYRISYHGGDGNDVVLNDTTRPSEAVLNLFGTVEHSTTSPAAGVYALYEAVLDRAPDPLGLENFTAAIQAGTSLTAVANALLTSAEHGGPTTDASAYVQGLYADLLNRSADSDGLRFFTGELNQGASQATVAVQIATSAEAQAVIKPVFDTGVFVTDAIDAAVAREYYAVLGRTPDATGLQAFEFQVKQAAASGGANGAIQALGNVANAMLNSSEYASTHMGQTDAGFVDSLYVGALGRHAEPGGAAFYADQLAHGVSHATVALEISQSAEAQLHLIRHIENGFHLIG